MRAIRAAGSPGASTGRPAGAFGSASGAACFRRRAERSPAARSGHDKFLGDYGSSPDITGGMGGEGVDAFAKFLDAGGTLICTNQAVQFPTDGHETELRSTHRPVVPASSGSGASTPGAQTPSVSVNSQALMFPVPSP